MISLTTLICVASAVAIKRALASYNAGSVVTGSRYQYRNTLLGKSHCAATFGIQKVADRVAPRSFQLLQTGHRIISSHNSKLPLM